MKKVLFIAIILQSIIWTGSAQNNAQDHSLEHLTLNTFKEKIFNYEQNKDWKYEGELPAIIDFYADWCRPCKMVAPILDELSKDYKGKIVIYKVDTQSQQELAAMLGIQSLPTFLFIPTEGKPQLTVGAFPKEQFQEHIKNILKVN